MNKKLVQDFWDFAEGPAIEWRMSRRTGFDLLLSFNPDRLLSPEDWGKESTPFLCDRPVHIDNQLARGIMVGVDADDEERTFDWGNIDKTRREQREPSNTPFTKSWPLPKQKPESSYGSYGGVSYDWLLRPILAFIDWLNKLARAEKPKEKTSGEEMATLGELFEGYEDVDTGGLLTVDEARTHWEKL